MIAGACLVAAGLAVVVWNRALPELLAGASVATVILGVYYALH